MNNEKHFVYIINNFYSKSIHIILIFIWYQLIHILYFSIDTFKWFGENGRPSTHS